MSSDVQLHFAASCISFFIKVGLAYFLCRLISELLNSPRRRFAAWLGFMLGSLAYWAYVIADSLSFLSFSYGSGITTSGAVHVLPGLGRPLLISQRFQHAAVVSGRIAGWTYIAGVLLLISIGIWKRIRLQLLLRQGEQPSAELKQLFSSMCRDFGVRHCELLVLAKLSSPATVCWWRPRILLPQACAELAKDSAIADVLYHELAHVARRDYLSSSVNDLICRVLFFHPVVWLARKQMRLHREMACDHAVVAARPEHRADYAHTLTQVARLCLSRRYPIIGIDFAAAPSLLSHRVHAILSDPGSISRMQKLFRSAAGLALVGAYVFLCSTIAVALAFVPSSAAVSHNLAVQASLKPQVHVALKRGMRRDVAARNDAGISAVAESPAYRMATSNGSEHTPLEAESPDSATVESGGSNIPNWMPPQPGASAKPGRTVESIILATVGAVILDKDDRKHKDSSNHFQSSTVSPY